MATAKEILSAWQPDPASRMGVGDTRDEAYMLHHRAMDRQRRVHLARSLVRRFPYGSFEMSGFVSTIREHHGEAAATAINADINREWSLIAAQEKSSDRQSVGDHRQHQQSYRGHGEERDEDQSMDQALNQQYLKSIASMMKTGHFGRRPTQATQAVHPEHKPLPAPDPATKSGFTGFSVKTHHGAFKPKKVTEANPVPKVSPMPEPETTLENGLETTGAGFGLISEF